ncbi:MAG: peptidylprolyl isomerase [Phycisphaerae bacterium]|jgi:cyclophilin family peptidyl-prolyl cis-trans isomerase
MSTKVLAVASALCMAGLALLLVQPSEARSGLVDWGSHPQAILHTSAGDITLLLRNDAAPLTVQHFIGFCRNHVYDGVIFDQVSPSFIYGGDILPDGSLKYSPHAYQWEEREIDSPLTHTPGHVGIRDFSGTEDTHLFNICVEAYPAWDGLHTVFAEVIGGMDIVEAVYASGDEDGVPHLVVVIESVEIVEAAQ